MKKITSLAIAFVLIVLPASAQNKWVHFGLKGGLSLSNLKNETGIRADYTTGYHIGAFTNFELPGNFSLQPEISYSQQGAKYSDGKEHLIDYINVPVLAMYRFNNGLRVHTARKSVSRLILDLHRLLRVKAMTTPLGILKTT